MTKMLFLLSGIGFAARLALRSPTGSASPMGFLESTAMTVEAIYREGSKLVCEGENS